MGTGSSLDVGAPENPAASPSCNMRNEAISTNWRLAAEGAGGKTWPPNGRKSFPTAASTHEH